MVKRARRVTKAKREERNFLANVPEECIFRCCDGRVFRNMQELRDALSTMTDESFACHSNNVKSDFSNWVRDTIGDEKLARDLGKASSRAVAAGYVAARIASLSQ